MRIPLSTYRPSVVLYNLILFFFSGVMFLFAWNIPDADAQSERSYREQIERIIEQAVSELDPEESETQIRELIEFLEDLAANPVNINRATTGELVQVPGITFQHAQAIIRHREEIKPFENVEELEDVEGIGSVTANRIKVFLTAGSALERSRDLLFSSNYWTSNSRFEALSRYQQVIENQEGYNRADSLGGYLGSPVKYNHRYRYKSDHLSLSLTQDKDPGEPVSGFTDFDYTSWHIALANNGRLQQLIIGDYKISFGQGLTLWNGGAFGKSSRATNGINKNERGIRPYTSSQETNAFRGIAATYGERLQISGFYSSRKRTASEADELQVRFPTQSPMHRTSLEQARRLNLGQETVGGRIRYQFRYGFVGISGYKNYFDRPVAPGTQSYQIFQYSGQHLSAFSANYRIVAGPVLFFGEAGRTQNGGMGVIGGSEFELSPSSELAIAYRNYGKKFQSIFGSGFGNQSSNPQNEEGFYVGLQQELPGNLLINTYFDHFKSHTARFRNQLPTSGFEWLGRIEFTPSSKLQLYTQLKYKRQEQEYEIENDLGRLQRAMGHDVRANLRVHSEYQVSPVMRLRTRFDIVKARQTIEEPATGYLIFQDIRLTPRSNLTIDARVTMFETDDFSARVFQFENDLLYVMSNTMLSDQGQRMYILLNYRPSDWIQLWFKASSTLYENRTTISSGLQEIKGNRRTDIGIQARVQF